MKYILIALVFAMSSQVVFAWGTVWPWATHAKITGDVIDNTLTNDMTNDDYPDIIKFREKLEDGSDTESHQLPGQSKEWAPTPELWYASGSDDCAIKKYQNNNFLEAYKDIGRELHLIQDSYVPVHNKKCYHALDDLECWAQTLHSYSNTETSVTFELTYHLLNEESDLYTSRFNYWLGDTEDDDDGDELSSDSCDTSMPDGPNEYGITSTWGTYGMPPNSYLDGIGHRVLLELLPGINNGIDYYGNVDGNHIITYEALWKSYNATLGKLKERSEFLPPIIPDNEEEFPDITPALFGPNMATTISFSVLENRKKTVLMTIEASESAIEDDEGTVWDGSEDATYDLDSYVIADQLPFYSIINIVWNGDMNTGTLSDGQHTVTIQVEDEDTNVSEIRSRSVKYDATPPTGTITIEGI